MRTIAIIGGGFCGSVLATHLLRSARRHDSASALKRIMFIERSDRHVGGVAYGTTSGSHALNVPAGRMSAFEDDADHFLRYARLRDPSITGGSFVPRRMYGEYLARTLDDARRDSAIPLIRVSGEAIDVEVTSGNLVVRLGDGRALRADQAVLAIGNFPPADPPVAEPSFYSSIRYARNPWAPDGLEMDHREAVLLLGTGLTMLDIALALRDADHQGVIHAVSRRGLLPQPHRVSAKTPAHADRPAGIDGWPASIRGMLRELRREVRAAASRQIDWREVVTSIRHDTPALWQRLNQEQRWRFLRHLRPYWETHRHRSAPSTALGVDTMIESGRLHVMAARLIGYHEDDDGVSVRVRPRASFQETTLRVGKVINCTGPDTDLSRVRDPLTAALRQSQLIRPDPLGLGLDADEHGAVIDARGRASQRLWLLGPLRKGRLWENTAVPELRIEAQRLASRLVQHSV